jgi:hypothetical protein
LANRWIACQTTRHCRTASGCFGTGNRHSRRSKRQFWSRSSCERLPRRWKYPHLLGAWAITRYYESAWHCRCAGIPWNSVSSLPAILCSSPARRYVIWSSTWFSAVLILATCRFDLIYTIPSPYDRIESITSENIQELGDGQHIPSL